MTGTHRRAGSVQESRSTSAAMLPAVSFSSASSSPSSGSQVLGPAPNTRRPRASTISHSSALDLVDEGDEMSSSALFAPSAGTLRHSDAATRQLVSALTKRSKTLADAVARRRESRSRCTSIRSPSPPNLDDPSPSSDVSPQSHDVELSAAPSDQRRRAQAAASPTKPPNMPLPPVPNLPPAHFRKGGPGSSSASVGGHLPSAQWDALLASAQQLSMARGRSADGHGSARSASSTPSRTPTTVLCPLPSTIHAFPLPRSRPQPYQKARLARKGLDEEAVCESSEDDILDDELSLIEHSLNRSHTNFAASDLSHKDDSLRTPQLPREYGSTSADPISPSNPSRLASRYETPDSTPMLPAEPFNPGGKQMGALLKVPAGEDAEDHSLSKDHRRSADSVSTAASDSSPLALFEIRSRGNSTSTKASSFENPIAPQMLRSFSQGSSVLPFESRPKEASIPPRRNSLFVATPPIRMASLENLRAAQGPQPLLTPADSSVMPAHAEQDEIALSSSSLGLCMTPSPSNAGSSPQRKLNDDEGAKPALLGSWMDASLARNRPNRAYANVDTLGWLDGADSGEDSDEQRFMPRPVRGAHRRFNSMDSSILSVLDSEVGSIFNVDRAEGDSTMRDNQQPAGAVTATTAAPELKRSGSMTPDQTPKSSPVMAPAPLLLPSESIARRQGQRRRPSSSQGWDEPQPYAGLQARSLAKIQPGSMAAFSIPSRNIPSGPPMALPSALVGGLYGSLGPPRHHPLTLAGGPPRDDPDNQCVSSIAFSYAPTPPITPLRATAQRPSTADTAMTPHPAAVVGGSRGLASGQALAAGAAPSSGPLAGTAPRVSGRIGAPMAPPPSSYRMEGSSSRSPHDQSGMPATAHMSRSSSTMDMPAVDPDSQSYDNAPHSSRPSISSQSVGHGSDRSAASSAVRLGKLRTTIFDSLGIKKTGGRPSDEGSAQTSVAGTDRAQSSMEQHISGVDSPGGALSSLIRRTSVSSGQSGRNGSGYYHYNGAVASTSSSSSSSLSKSRAAQMSATMLSPTGSPLKRTMKLPDSAESSMHHLHRPPSASTSSVSSASRRDRIPSSDSQVSLHGPSKHSLRSGHSSSIHHGTSTTPSSQHSSPALDQYRFHAGGSSSVTSGGGGSGSGRRSHTTTQLSDRTGQTSVRSGSSSGQSGGRSGKNGAPSVRPVRKEEVARVNAVLAELQGAAFMAPPKKKPSSSAKKEKGVSHQKLRF